MQYISVNHDLCTGCQACQLVCSFYHFNEFNLRRSAIRIPLEGMFPGKAQVCKQCSNPACVRVCPSKALTMTESSIKFDREKCSGCGLCIEACPFNAIYLDPQDGFAIKCDLCNGEFLCVKYCQKKAISIKNHK